MAKKALFTVACWALAVGPAFAGDGGALDGAGTMLLQALGRLVGKFTGMF